MDNLDHGFLILNKPKGITSRQLVNQISRQTKLKVGHTGTLDPLASGMMVLCIGDATKFSQWLISSDKAYDATIQFGRQTTTDDAEGDIIASAASDAKIITQSDVQAVLTEFTGKILQRPPIFSAIHINGKRAYKLARSNKDVIMPQRSVTVHDIQLVAFDDSQQEAKLTIHCQSGTYIRSIARDLGFALNNFAFLSELKRTWVSPFSAQDLPQVDETPPVISLDYFFSHLSALPRADLTYEQAQTLAHGQLISLDDRPNTSASGTIVVFHANCFLGIISPSDTNTLLYKSTKLRSHILEILRSLK